MLSIKGLKALYAKQGLCKCISCISLLPFNKLLPLRQYVIMSLYYAKLNLRLVFYILRKIKLVASILYTSHKFKIKLVASILYTSHKFNFV